MGRPGEDLGSARMTTRGFFRRRTEAGEGHRLPPGQYEERGFPVLSYEPTPSIPLTEWEFVIKTITDRVAWSWDEMMSLPQTDWTVDIHCVTKWSKFGTTWRGVTVDDLIAAAGIEVKEPFCLVYSHTPYTTNLPTDDLIGGKAMVVHTFDGRPLDPEHGGPARLLVPHLYFWKSAKWVRGLRFIAQDIPGFWETYGYHNRGDPWLEQRYAGD
jgi:DMSO/TMAO reductase YedYZ molybdopterin-dependent catalytic subunit